VGHGSHGPTLRSTVGHMTASAAPFEARFDAKRRTVVPSHIWELAGLRPDLHLVIVAEPGRIVIETAEAAQDHIREQVWSMFAGSTGDSTRDIREMREEDVAVADRNAEHRTAVHVDEATSAARGKALLSALGL
jgi:bifunctional DNA-binding transcriptional regulator/antitoxin component of YhaV-PrlF toxin-antitoxin module